MYTVDDSLRVTSIKFIIVYQKRISFKRSAVFDFSTYTYLYMHWSEDACSNSLNFLLFFNQLQCTPIFVFLRYHEMRRRSSRLPMSARTARITNAELFYCSFYRAKTKRAPPRRSFCFRSTRRVRFQSVLRRSLDSGNGEVQFAKKRNASGCKRSATEIVGVPAEPGTTRYLFEYLIHAVHSLLYITFIVITDVVILLFSLNYFLYVQEPLFFDAERDKFLSFIIIVSQCVLSRYFSCARKYTHTREQTFTHRRHLSNTCTHSWNLLSNHLISLFYMYTLYA